MDMPTLLPGLPDRWNADDTAIIGPDGSGITYGDLSCRVEDLAALLSTAGFGPGQRVAVLQSKRIDAVVSILALLRVGAAYVPLSPRWPMLRLRQSLVTCGIGAVLVHPQDSRHLAWLGDESGFRLLDVTDAEAAASDAGSVRRRAPEGGDIAYMICTSGTSGTPKAVMIRRESLAAFLDAVVQCSGYDRSMRWLSVAPLHFDASTLDFLPLAAGGTLVLLDRAMLPGDVLRPMAQHRITDTMLISSLLRAAVGRHADLAAYDLSNLRTLWYGGESCPTAVLRAFAAAHPHVRFRHGYGPSETCNTATLFDFEGVPADAPDYMPIGKPLATVEAYALDENRMPVGPGGTGELWIGGIQVMAGYCGDPARSAAVLVPNFMNPESPYPLYRTGDKVAVDDDGNFVYLGRDDDLVKTRGHLVSLIEIQTALLDALPIADAIIVTTPDPVAGNRLDAFLVSNRASVDKATAVQALRRTLPPQMIPDAFHHLAPEDVPRRDTGKVDLKALQALAAERRLAASIA